jgi:hypothetical protein
MLDRKLAKLFEGKGITDRATTCIGGGGYVDNNASAKTLYPSAIEAREPIEAEARKAGCDDEMATKLWLLARGPHCWTCFTLIAPFAAWFEIQEDPVNGRP